MGGMAIADRMLIKTLSIAMNEQMDKPQNETNMTGVLERHYPVTVVINKVWRQHRQWRYPDWMVSGVIPEGSLSEGLQHDSTSHRVIDNGKKLGKGYRNFREENGSEHFIWPGLQFSLYRDGLTSYFHNLHGDQPCLFILCRDDNDQTGLEPIAVSADFSDAEAHMETEGTVLTSPLVSPFDKWIADYVLQNKVHLQKQAQQSKKHKRKRATTQS